MKIDFMDMIKDMDDKVNRDKVIELLAKAKAYDWDWFTTAMLLYDVIYGKTLKKEYCSWLVDNMYCGNEHGRKWSVEETNELARKAGISFDDLYTHHEFNAVVHMMYYDYGHDMKEAGVNGEIIFAKMADSYLADEDAPKGRLVNHFFFTLHG